MRIAHEGPRTATGRAAQATRSPDPPDALGELWRDADRHDERGAHLVQGARHAPQEPPRVGEDVGRPDADDQRREAQAVIDGREDALERDDATEASRRPPSPAAGSPAG